MRHRHEMLNDMCQYDACMCAVRAGGQMRREIDIVLYFGRNSWQIIIVNMLDIYSVWSLD